MEGINTLLLHCSFDYVFLLLDINECDLNVCHEDANCTNTIGSFECQCRPGYSGDGRTCDGKHACICVRSFSTLLIIWQYTEG